MTKKRNMRMIVEMENIISDSERETIEKIIDKNYDIFMEEFPYYDIFNLNTQVGEASEKIIQAQIFSDITRVKKESFDFNFSVEALALSTGLNGSRIENKMIRIISEITSNLAWLNNTDANRAIS